VGKQERGAEFMKIRAGYRIAYECVQPTPMLLVLGLHPSRLPDLLSPQIMTVAPAQPTWDYRDSFGNVCTRILARPGLTTFSADFTVYDHGRPDQVEPSAEVVPLDRLPDDTLIYLLASRYCETDRLLDFAWAEFGNTPRGWGRVQAVCEFVNGHITFGYQHARVSRTAYEGYSERLGVCRDFAHLAVTLCRCMNIPARYCTGYLGDIGVPAAPEPMDFSAWFEAYLGGRWYTFDARHNHPRIGRLLMARGRDATDVAISTTFGPCRLAGFEVTTEEVA
jgi:transglutaminase-like putative cysteine protease